MILFVLYRDCSARQDSDLISIDFALFPAFAAIDNLLQFEAGKALIVDQMNKRTVLAPFENLFTSLNLK
ncbi:hypothetical protein [Nostoc foliaceum]|uniref:hypothetical protein n=1 Tax=Nostoc foliaceum TaxID=2692914 RepID=UPI001687F1EB|nr:hypothetical protein [Nostoc foliaceum]